MLLQKNRLTKDAEIKKVFAKSKRLASKGLIFYVHQRGENTGPVRISIVISAKVSKKATQRNRAHEVKRKDHTTVLHAVSKIEDSINSDKSFGEKISDIKKALNKAKSKQQN